MPTIAKPYTREVLPAVRKVRKSAVLSGIVPDARHLDQGGYHVSIADLVRFGNAGDYSNRAKLDKAPPVTTAGRDNACAIDISMNTADMKATYKAVETVWKNRATDTRAKYVNAINVWDGVKGHAPKRFNFQTGTKTNASKDHEWHAHGDWPRVWVDEQYNASSARRAARAMASIIVGQTHDAWLRQEQLGKYAPKPPAPAKPTPAPTAPAPEDDDTMITHSHTLPARYAYRTPDTAGIVDSSAILDLPLPPASWSAHRWGKDYDPPYISIAGDHMTGPQRVRVAINDGVRWHVKVVEIVDGGRVNVNAPPAAGPAAYNVVIGRVAPADLPADATLPDQLPGDDGVIGVLVELVRKK